MDDEKFERLLQRGEHERVAFYAGASDAQLHKVVATLAAMANGTGGTILFGVDKGGLPTGIFEEPAQVTEKIIRQISSWTTPTVWPTIEQLWLKREAPSGRDGPCILVIHILPAANPPVMVRGIAYHRRGAENVEMTRYQLDRTLHLMPQTFDRRAVPTASITDLDDSHLRRYMRQRQDAYPQSVPFIGTIEELWQEVQAVTLTEQGLIPNVAGILFFAGKPQRWIPHARIKLARFKGTAPLSFIDRKDNYGTLPELIDLAESFIRRNTRMASRVVGFESIQVTEYPYPALREALVNAFAHRDWEQRREAVQVNIFDNRIEVHSPGEPLLPLDQLEGAHATRNDHLCYLFKDIGEMEQYGTGVAKMRRLMQEHGLQAPRFEKQGPIFKVIFFGPGDGILDLFGDPTERVDLRNLGLNARQIEAMRVLRNQSKAISNGEYRQMFGISDRTALRDLNAMIKLGLVRRIGRGPQSLYVAQEQFDSRKYQ
ncbi:MAG: ATP-binding protein [Ardenticatenaceae bacterium]